MFKEEKWPPLLIPTNPTNVEDKDVDVYPNTWRLLLHIVANKLVVFPCAEMVKWIVDHANLGNTMIVNEKGKCIACFQSSSLEPYYTFTRVEVSLTPTLVEEFGRLNNYDKVMSKWWIEGKQFRSRDNVINATTNFREPYIYVVALTHWLFGEKNATNFKEDRVPLVYTIVKEGWIFNCVPILSHTMMEALVRAKYHNLVTPPELHVFML